MNAEPWAAAGSIFHLNKVSIKPAAAQIAWARKSKWFKTGEVQAIPE